MRKQLERINKVLREKERLEKMARGQLNLIECRAVAESILAEAMFENVNSIPMDTEVIVQLAEAFKRYLRAGNSFAKDNWTVNQIVKYEEDKDYCKTIYKENRLKMNFDDADELARTKLFEKIIKEVFNSKLPK